MEVSADAMARELRRHRIPRPPQQLMYRLAYQLQRMPRRAYADRRRKRVLGDLHEFPALLVLAHTAGLGFG